MAVGTTTLTHYTVGHVRRIVVDFVASSSDGTIPDTTLPTLEGRLFELHTNPGSTAPTDNYDITITDANAIDRLQGVGANRDTTTTEVANILYSGTSINPVVSRSDVLTLKFANNSVNSATGQVVLIYGLV